MSSNNNFYGSSVSNKRAPPPPPKKNVSATSTTARRANATKMSTSSRSSYQSNRSVPPSRPLSGNAPKLTGRTVINKSNKPSSTFGNSNTTMKNRARKAPVASRPVGSYYNSSAAASNETTSAASNLYAKSPAVPASTSVAGTAATTANSEETWDDWGSPAKPTTAATNNSSWAAPAPVPAAASTTNDWYSAGGGTGTTATSSASSGYTSSGFGNQSSQQQQQTAPIQPGNGSYQTNTAQQQQQQAAPTQPGSGFFQTNTAQQQQQQQQPFLSGAMDSSAPMMNPSNNNNQAVGSSSAPIGMSSFSMFMPSSVMQPQQSTNNDPYLSIEDEAPLLEELGINIQHMMLKSKAVVFPFSRFGGDQIDPSVICKDGDVPGPVALLLLLGAEMVLAGKLQFGYIYIYGLFGCIAMTLVVNLISPNEAVSFWTVTSIMGYALLPVNVLAFVKLFVINLINMQTLGNILGGLTVLWSTMASTRLLELGCGLRDQRYLIMYPLLLFYSAFVMMTIL